MALDELTLTYIGGPTILIEWGGLRLLTDPTFDPAGTDYPTNVYTLHKTAGPAVSAEAIGQIQAVLLSHDHHFDNLDRAGRDLLSRAGKVLTTQAGAERLGQGAVGLVPWQSVDLPAPDGRVLRVTGTPARHGPVGGDRGPVIGFALAWADAPDKVVYISGDTVWYEGVAQVAQRYPVRLAILFMGAATVREVGPAHLTLTAEEAVQAAQTFSNALVVPLHFEGWAHFAESRREIETAFRTAGRYDQLYWLEPGQATKLNIK